MEHYLDDYIVLRTPAFSCVRQTSRVCGELGVPLVSHKREGPATCLTFLGIEIDPVAGSLRLPAERLHRLVSTIENWGDRKVCTCKELKSPIGQLNHVCKVVRPGQMFLRCMIDLLIATRPGTSHCPHHHIRLKWEFQADLAWWGLFLPSWNGFGIVEASNSSPNIGFTSYASGSWGCEAWHGVRWFQHPWSETEQCLDISIKELFPIVIAAVIWGLEWKGARITYFCDNQVVVSVMHSRSCCDKQLVHLLWCLFYYEAHGLFKIGCKHIPGSRNGIADDLSRNNLTALFLKMLGASTSPSNTGSSGSTHVVGGPGLALPSLDPTIRGYLKQGLAVTT